MLTFVLNVPTMQAKKQLYFHISRPNLIPVKNQMNAPNIPTVQAINQTLITISGLIPVKNHINALNVPTVQAINQTLITISGLIPV